MEFIATVTKGFTMGQTIAWLGKAIHEQVQSRPATLVRE